MRLIILLTFLLLICSVQPVLGQEKNEEESSTDETEQFNVLVNAQVIKGGSPFQNVDVVLKVNGKTVRQRKTGSDGFFELILEFDSVYVIAFEKEGYIPKSVEVDTRNLPEEDRFIGYDVGMFKMSMSKIQPGVLVGPYKKPMARFVYDPRTQNFVVDRDYKKERKEDFEKLKQKEIEPIKF